MAWGQACQSALQANLQQVEVFDNLLRYEIGNAKFSISLKDQSVTHGEAVLVAKEIAELQSLSNGVLEFPKSMVVRLHSESGSDQSVFASNLLVDLPVKFAVRPIPGVKVTEEQKSYLAQAVRLHELGHALFHESMERDLESYRMLAKVMSAGYRSEVINSRYRYLGHILSADSPWLQKLKADPKRLARYNQLQSQLYYKANEQRQKAIELDDALKAKFGGDSGLEKLKKIAAVQELFADFIASLQMDSVAVIRETQEAMGFSPQSPQVLGRAFDRQLAISGWAPRDPHLVLGPVRSYLGPAIIAARSAEQKRVLLSVVYEILQDKVDQILRKPNFYVYSAEKLNLEIINSLAGRIVR